MGPAMSTPHSSPASSPGSVFDDGVIGRVELLGELAEALYTNMPSVHKDPR